MLMKNGKAHVNIGSKLRTVLCSGVFTTPKALHVAVIVEPGEEKAERGP